MEITTQHQKKIELITDENRTRITIVITEHKEFAQLEIFSNGSNQVIYLNTKDFEQLSSMFMLVSFELKGLLIMLNSTEESNESKKTKNSGK